MSYSIPISNKILTLTAAPFLFILVNAMSLSVDFARSLLNWKKCKQGT